MTLGPAAGLPGRVWVSAGPHWITDVGKDECFARREIALAAGLCGALGFPIVINEQVIGVMEFFTRAWRDPDRALDTMLMVIGGEVGQFMSRTAADEALRAAKESLDKANRAKDRFFAMLSHELRTPLSPALLVAASMAEDSTLPAQVREDGRMIQRNIELQTRLIDDLLDVSRIENGKLTIQHERVDLHEALRDCVRICRHEAVAKGLEVVTEFQAARRLINGDPTRLRQVVCNLVKNAIKFTPANGTITLRTTDAETADDHVRLEVLDTGVGMTPEMLQKMFDPFEQAGRAAESKGLGLGLTICKGLVEAHGGRIAASSRGPGLGLTIEVELPASAALPDGPAGADRVAESGASEGAPCDKPEPMRILLVDDHADTLRALSRLLRKLEHNVLTADSVRTALASAAENKFDLVISDVGLPDGTGTDLMRELLKLQSIRGIALTGYGSESDLRETREAGFSAHLTKPINFTALRAAIGQARPS